MKTKNIVLVFILTLNASYSHAEESALIGKLRSANAWERSSVVAEIAKSSDSSIDSDLLAIVNTSQLQDRSIKRNGILYDAILLLGQRKVTNSIPWLIENIDIHTSDYYQASQSQEFRSLRDYFPCVTSLLLMEKLSSSEVVAGYAADTDVVKSRLLAATIGLMLKFGFLNENELGTLSAEKMRFFKNMDFREYPPVRRKAGGVEVKIENW